MPHAILRATQFHDLVEQLFTVQRRLPVVLAPDFPLQPISTSDVADRLVELVAAGPSGRVPDIGGPAVRSLPELGRVFASARGSRRRVVPIRPPGRMSAGYRAGHALVPGEPYGRIQFEERLARRSGG